MRSKTTASMSASANDPSPRGELAWSFEGVVHSRLSGTVVGALLNDPATLAALGAAIHAPPYKAAPREPVLQVKPRNTFAHDGDAVALPVGATHASVGASLALVVGRTARRVRAAEAGSCIAGWTLAVDLHLPIASHYRPAVRQRAFDRSCFLGPRIVDATALGDADAQRLLVRIRTPREVASGPAAPEEGAQAPWREHLVSTAGLLRGAFTLLQDVSHFMTLHPGDVLMLGVREGAPTAQAGDTFEVSCDAIGCLRGSVVAS
jgi:5-oxopent-3-ene-1,2,5-tricarboxylate decarboxylase / 2-hydroxyhepta-2,4-diene-1,7-dioate isomerase